MMGVVALGLLGAAYTLWYEDLTITSQVTTGDFNADVSLHPWDGEDFGDGVTAVGDYDGSGKPVVIVCNEPIPAGLHAAHLLVASFTPPGTDPYDCLEATGDGSFPAGKPPTVCDAEIATIPNQANDVSDNNHLILTMSGLYPFAGCQYQVDLHSTGSVPLHVSWTDWSYELCDSEGDNCADLPWNEPGISVLQSCTAPDGEARTPTAVLENEALGPVVHGPNNPVQLHKGEELLCDVAILLDQGAGLENKVIKASRTFRTHQWNEAVD